MSISADCRVPISKSLSCSRVVDRLQDTVDLLRGVVVQKSEAAPATDVLDAEQGAELKRVEVSTRAKNATLTEALRKFLGR